MIGFATKITFSLQARSGGDVRSHASASFMIF
jgi:hypothetical protein